MRTLISVLLFYFFSNSLFCQLKWEHTNGPEGTASKNLFCGDDFAYVTDNLYLYRSSDGLTWEKLPYPGIQSLTILKSTLAALFINPSNITGGETFLKISHDNGEHWKEIPKPSIDMIYSSMNLLNHGLYIIDQTRTKLLYSINEGLDWQEKIIPIPNIEQMYCSEVKIYLTDKTSLWRSDELGNNWTEIKFPALVLIFQVIAHDSSLVVFVENGIYSSNDYGNTWSFVSIDWYSFFKTLPVFETKDTFIYMSYEFNGFARSTDLFDKQRIDLNPAKRLPFITKFKLFKGQLIVQTDGLGIHYWDENAFTLIESNTGFVSPNIWHTSNTPNYVWAGTPNTVYGYDLNANSWTIDTKLSTPSKYFNFISGNQDGWLTSFSDTSFGHFYFSKDEGKNWENIIVGNTKSPKQVRWITILDQIIFVHLTDSVWRSDDLGLNWKALPYRLLNQIVKHKNQYITADTSKFYYSNDQGVHWDSLTELKGKLLEGLEVQNDLLFTTIDIDGRELRSGYSLYKSTNGIDWYKADNGLPLGAAKLKFGDRRPGDKIFFNYQNSYYLNLGITGLYMAKDTMLNWIKIDGGTGLTFTNYHIIDSTVFGGTAARGMFKASLNSTITKNDNPIAGINPNEILIYPNPFNNKIQIELSTNEPITIIIYDQNGQKLKQLIRNSKTIELDLNNYHSGIYYIQFLGNHHNEIRKLIKNY